MQPARIKPHAKEHTNNPVQIPHSRGHALTKSRGRKSPSPTLGNPPEEGNLGQSKNKAPPPPELEPNTPPVPSGLGAGGGTGEPAAPEDQGEDETLPACCPRRLDKKSGAVWPLLVGRDERQCGRGQTRNNARGD